jgi:hypothetical protein
MNQIEAVELARQFLVEQQLEVADLKGTVLMPELNALALDGFPGPNWYVFFFLPPHPKVAPDATVGLCVNVTHKRVQLLP